MLNATLAALKPGDELVFPANQTFHLVGGIKASNLRNNVIHFNGAIKFTDNIKTWPRKAGGQVLECLHFETIQNVTFTSNTVGLLDGSGEAWWGYIGYLEYLENRPRMLTISNSKDILVENLYFKSSPYWTVWIHGVDGLEIRFSEISNRRDDYDGHDLWNLGAFNTDGFDVTGRNVWIHDVKVWNQDDCIAVKDDSENMLIERVEASGLGLTIGSIGGSTVRNITFRDAYMHHTYKGIYAKFRGPGVIENVLYENIVMDAPEQWPIWIGPAQQADSVDICKADPCSLCWPELPFAECNMPANASYIDITLRNVTIRNPKQQSAGVIIGSATNPMRNVLFDDVVVQNSSPSSSLSSLKYFACENAQGVATGGTTPVPACFKNENIKFSSFD